MDFGEEKKMETLALPTVGEESAESSFRTDPDASLFMQSANPTKMEQMITIDEDEDENRETIAEEMKESVSPLPVAMKTQVSEPA